MSSLRLFAPAKLNFFLAITGRRTDGFHDLVSFVAPVEFGDELAVEATKDGAYSLSCDVPGVPSDDTNLVLRAARLFAAQTGWTGGARFHLTKRIPMGAGLGGGSSDGTAALLALNQLAGLPLPVPALSSLAAQLGSDCPLFLENAPCVMRGRGEQVQPIAGAARARVTGRRVLIFKPDFGINTAWAYQRMAADPEKNYLPPAAAETRLSEWLASDGRPLEELVFNHMERVAFAKYLALPVLLERLREKFGVAAGMSGSGSACFALLGEKTPADPIVAAIRNAWGAAAFAIETRIR